ncbi:hypothetical protein, partial [Bacillus thuringiensis]|uniref:hypothetical protein n=1 Tax=Bacillus thuringiensis TaxID=1428 RepID=UPI0021758992
MASALAHATGNLPAATASPSMLPSLSSRMADHKDLTPVSRAEFAAELVPCLALSVGVGMSEEDRKTWLNAAYKALDGIPIALLKRGAQAALMRADHPSKIVPIITKEIGEDWAWRRKASDPNWLRTETPAPDAKQDLCSPDDARAIFKRFGLDKPDDD